MIKITTFKWSAIKKGSGYQWEPSATYTIKETPEALTCLFSGVLFPYQSFIDGSDAYKIYSRNYETKDLSTDYLWRGYEREIAKLVKSFYEQTNAFYIHDWFNFNYQIKPGKYIQLVAEVV